MMLKYSSSQLNGQYSSAGTTSTVLMLEFETMSQRLFVQHNLQKLQGYG